MKRTPYFLAVVFVIFLAGCGSGNEGYTNVSVKQAEQLIAGQQTVVLDVRTREEFREGHIPKATLIPLQELNSRLSELDKSTTYLVVCRSGNRSAQASEILLKNGFTHIYNMTGGMNDWTYEMSTD